MQCLNRYQKIAVSARSLLIFFLNSERLVNDQQEKDCKSLNFLLLIGVPVCRIMVFWLPALLLAYILSTCVEPTVFALPCYRIYQNVSKHCFRRNLFH